MDTIIAETTPTSLLGHLPTVCSEGSPAAVGAVTGDSTMY